MEIIKIVPPKVYLSGDSQFLFIGLMTIKDKDLIVNNYIINPGNNKVKKLHSEAYFLAWHPRKPIFYYYYRLNSISAIDLIKSIFSSQKSYKTIRVVSNDLTKNKDVELAVLDVVENGNPLGDFKLSPNQESFIWRFSDMRFDNSINDYKFSYYSNVYYKNELSEIPTSEYEWIDNDRIIYSDGSIIYTINLKNNVKNKLDIPIKSYLRFERTTEGNIEILIYDDDGHLTKYLYDAKLDRLNKNEVKPIEEETNEWIEMAENQNLTLCNSGDIVFVKRKNPQSNDFNLYRYSNNEFIPLISFSIDEYLNIDLTKSATLCRGKKRGGTVIHDVYRNMGTTPLLYE